MKPLRCGPEQRPTSHLMSQLRILILEQQGNCHIQLPVLEVKTEPGAWGLPEVTAQEGEASKSQATLLQPHSSHPSPVGEATAL